MTPMQSAKWRHAIVASCIWGVIFCGLAASQIFVQARLSHDRSELAEKEQLLAKLKLQPVMHADGADTDRTGETLHAQTSTVAASEFQKLVQQTLSGAGSVLHSVQSDSEEISEAAGQVKVALQVVFDGNIEAVQKVLHQLETGTPYVFVDAVTIRPDSTPTEATSELLRVTLSISSYWRNSEGSN